MLLLILVIPCLIHNSCFYYFPHPLIMAEKSFMLTLLSSLKSATFALPVLFQLDIREEKSFIFTLLSPLASPVLRRVISKMTGSLSTPSLFFATILRVVFCPTFSVISLLQVLPLIATPSAEPLTNI